MQDHNGIYCSCQTAESQQDANAHQAYKYLTGLLTLAWDAGVWVLLCGVVAHSVTDFDILIHIFVHIKVVHLHDQRAVTIKFITSYVPAL